METNNKLSTSSSSMLSSVPLLTKQLKWEDVIPNYSVEEVLNAFDSNMPKQNDTKKWSLIFTIISKLTCQQILNLISSFVTEARTNAADMNLVLGPILLATEEENHIRSIFTKSHPFYSVLYYNLDIETIYNQNNTSNDFLCSLWIDGINVKTNHRDSPKYCPLYFLLATNKNKKKLILDLFFKFIFTLQSEEKQTTAIVNFYSIVLNSTILENIVCKFIFQLENNNNGNKLTLTNGEKLCFLKIQEESMNILKSNNNNLSPSWIDKQTSNEKNICISQFAFKIYNFVLKIEQNNMNKNVIKVQDQPPIVIPLVPNVPVLSQNDINDGSNSNNTKKNKIASTSKDKRKKNAMQRNQKENSLKRTKLTNNRLKNPTKQSDNNNIPVDTAHDKQEEERDVEMPEINIYNVIDLIESDDVNESKETITDEDRSSSKPEKISTITSKDVNPEDVDTRVLPNYIGNSKSHSELCDRLEYYFNNNKGSDRKNPFTAYDSILSDTQEVLSADVDFITVQHQIGASILLHLYLSMELTSVQKKNISLHCLSMICPMDTSMSQLEAGSSVHNIEETKELENSMLNFYINGQNHLLQDDDVNNIEENKKTFLFKVLPHSYRSALMFLKNQFQNIDKADDEKRKETNTLITKGNSLMHAYINVLDKNHDNIVINNCNDTITVVQEISNLTMEFLEFVNVIASDFMSMKIDSSITKKYVLNGMARSFHAFFSIMSKIRVTFTKLLQFDENENSNNGFNIILRSTPLFCEIFDLTLPNEEQMEQENIIPVEFRKTIGSWALLIQNVLKKSKTKQMKDFETSIFRGIAKIKGTPHLSYCFFTASIFSFTQENATIFLTIFVQLIHKEDPINELPRSIFHSLHNKKLEDNNNNNNNSIGEKQLIDFCKFAVRVFEKCVYNLGKAKKGAKSPTTSNSIDDKKTIPQLLLTKFSTILGSLALYKYTRQIILESNIIKICGMVLLRGNLPVGIAVNASIILSYIFQNVIDDEDTDLEGSKTLIENILKYPGVLYGLKRRLTPSLKTMVYDHRLTGNCVEIFKYIVELFVANDRKSRIENTDDIKVVEYVKKITSTKYQVHSLLASLVNVSNKHLVESIKIDHEISINLLYICIQISALLHKYRSKLMPNVDWLYPGEFYECLQEMETCEEMIANNLLDILKNHVPVENKKEVVHYLKYYVMKIKKYIENANSDGGNDLVGINFASLKDTGYWPEGKASVFCKTLHEKIKIRARK